MKSTGENIRFMGRKYLLIFTAVFFIVLFPLSSRSLFDVGLKVVTLYDVDEAVESDGFFSGMSEGANWNFGFGLEGRLSVLHVSVLSTAVFGDENLMNLYYTALMDIPIINDVVYLSLGGGLSNQLNLPQEDGEELSFCNRREGDSFVEFMKDSPIHLKASIDIIFGPSVLSFFYLRETSSRIGDSIDSIFTSDGSNKGGVSLTLMLF